MVGLKFREDTVVWAKPRFPLSEVDAAGQVLIDRNASAPDRNGAHKVS